MTSCQASLVGRTVDRRPWGRGFDSHARLYHFPPITPIFHFNFFS